MPDSSGKYTKEHYKKLYEFSKKFCFSLETSFYENNGKLRDLIKIKNIKPDLDNLPSEILTELKKIKYF